MGVLKAVDPTVSGSFKRERLRFGAAFFILRSFEMKQERFSIYRIEMKYISDLNKIHK